MTAAATSAIPRVNIAAVRSVRSRPALSWAGSGRGAGGWTTVGGRQPYGGRGWLGGPGYGRAGGVTVVSGAGPLLSPGAGRRQNASSSEGWALLVTSRLYRAGDGTAAASRRRVGTLRGVERQDAGLCSGEPAPAEDRREVRLPDVGEDLVILPDTTVDDTDAGWGERHGSNDARLLDERPPHWG